MKKMNKLMAIGLSLVLCLSMIAPAFAEDAYFYLEEEGQWEFLGQGEIRGEAPFDENGNIAVDELGKPLIVAPQPTETEGTTQKLEAQTGTDEQDLKDTTVEVDTSLVDTLLNKKDYGEYKYDNSGDDVLNDEKTYTVTWTVKEDGGANAYIDEDGNVVPAGTDGATWVQFAKWEDTTIHVDGKVEKSDNAQVTVVVKDFKNGSETEGNTYGQGDSLYVRESVANAETEESVARRDAAVNSAAETITGKLKEEVKSILTEDNYDTSVENKDGQLVKTYSEKTYTVTYVVSGADDVDGLVIPDKETKGKVSEAWANLQETLIGNTLSNMGAAGGYYSFSRWEPEVDKETGNVTLKAVCTFNPYYYGPVGTGDVTIEDEAVPLAAGPVTRAEFVDYLWRHEGEPDSEGVCTFTDVEDTHEYFDALCWAEENGVAAAYFDAEDHEDGTFEPDELVTVGAVREFLDNFADVFGTNAVAAADLTTLTGEDGEAVLNCDQVLAEFFGEEYELPEDLDALEPDTAA